MECIFDTLKSISQSADTNTMTASVMRVLWELVVLPGSFLGLHHWTGKIGKITSICLHDCLDFIAFYETFCCHKTDTNNICFCVQNGVICNEAALLFSDL